MHIAPYILHKTHQSCEAVRKVLSPQLFFALYKIYGTLCTKVLVVGAFFVVVLLGLNRNLSWSHFLTRGRKRRGTVRHCCSAEREEVGGLNVLRRGGYVCAMLPTYNLTKVFRADPSTSRWFFLNTHIICASILPRVVFSHHISCVLPLLPWGGFFLVLFWKSTKNFGLAFLRVSGRRGCLKRPLRASNLFGVSATIPTVPPLTPQNPTAEIIEIPRGCVVSRNGKVLCRQMFCVREVFEACANISYFALFYFTSKADRLFSLWIYLLLYIRGCGCVKVPRGRGWVAKFWGSRRDGSLVIITTR